jgi:putative addiction module killer protein
LRIVQTREFIDSLATFRDIRAQVRIAIAAERMANGNFGDSKSLGEGVMEARIHFGPGYRIYYCRRGDALVVLLLCGAKPSQQSDIRRAKALAGQL